MELLYNIPIVGDRNVFNVIEVFAFYRNTMARIDIDFKAAKCMNATKSLLFGIS